MPLPDRKKYDSVSIRLDTVQALDGETDVRICYNNIALCMYCVLTRDKDVDWHQVHQEDLRRIVRHDIQPFLWMSIASLGLKRSNNSTRLYTVWKTLAWVWNLTWMDHEITLTKPIVNIIVNVSK